MYRFSATMIPRIFHAATFGYNIFVAWLWLNMNIPSNINVNMPNLKDYWWQYLTVWNMNLQTTYFVICVVDDNLQNSKHQKQSVNFKKGLEWARDTMFQSLILPLCMVVFGLFWVTFFYDRELVYPAGMDAVVPFWYNHIIHTAILFFPWAEMVICQRPFFQCKTRYLFGMVVLALYNVILIAASYWQGYWTYPILNLMTPIQKTLYFALLYGIYTTSYIIGCKANQKICGVGVGGSMGISHKSIDKKLS